VTFHRSCTVITRMCHRRVVQGVTHAVSAVLGVYHKARRPPWDVGYYFKRLTAIDAVLGNTDFHLNRYAKLA
jgi:hypothetical protein